jgi:hypothetical protein
MGGKFASLVRMFLDLLTFVRRRFIKSIGSAKKVVRLVNGLR